MNIDLNKVQRFLDWLKTQLYLDTLVVNASRRVVKRGQVYRCNFGMGIGSEMQKERPAVIVQNSIGNLKSGNTIVIPITHDTSTLPCVAVITTQYEADGTTTKLDGQANASNIMCVSKSRLGTYICDLPASDMKKVDEALAKTMGLIGYYADLNKKLSDKLTYISKIKAERNTAQDTLKEIYSVFNKFKPEYLLNFAWCTTGDYLNSELNYKFLEAGINMLGAFKQNGGRRTVFAGTCFEYKFKDTPLKENDELNPLTIYAKCKVELFKQATEYCIQNGISFGWGRIFYVYGENENEKD